MRASVRFPSFTGLAALAGLLGALAPPPAAGETTVEEEAPAAPKLRWSVELKGHVRHSKEVEFRLGTPVPADHLRPGEDALFLRTSDAGTSMEVSTVAVSARYDISPHVTAGATLHFLDLYTRNPSSTRERVFVREAWARFGKEYASLEKPPGTSGYALFGLAPRFTKQRVRQLESYGLWGTSVGRLEQVQLQGGGSLGRSFYWRAHLANRNPVFFRDTNALAGDNGTPERVPGRVDPIYESGFPILYDTLPQDINFDELYEVGGGFGARLVGEESKDGVDALAWIFRGELGEDVHIRNTFYSGDLGLLEGNGGISLAFEGDEKSEWGVNVDTRWSRLRFFGQWVKQEIAELTRHGFEAEAAYRIPLGGLAVSGDRPVFNYLNLAFRFSNIDNEFAIPPGFVAPSMGWDWRKYDIGARLGIIRGVDLTAEYSRHDMVTARGTLHPDEFLVTLRVGFEGG